RSCRRRPSRPSFTYPGFDLRRGWSSLLSGPGTGDLTDGRGPVRDLTLDDLSDLLLHRTAIPLSLRLQGADDLGRDIPNSQRWHDSNMLASCVPSNKQLQARVIEREVLRPTDDEIQRWYRGSRGRSDHAP